MIANNDYTGLLDLACKISELRDYAEKQENHFKYEIEEIVADDEIPESWRLEKAVDALNKHTERVENKIEIMESRIERKRKQKAA